VLSLKAPVNEGEVRRSKATAGIKELLSLKDGWPGPERVSGLPPSNLLALGHTKVCGAVSGAALSLF